MIARARPGSALVALVLSLAATAALLPVFDGRGWFSRSIGLAVLVTITGVAARAVTRRWWAVLAVQLLGLVVAWAWTTTGSLSPVAVAESVGGLIRDARHTLMTYAAPAPTTPGVVAGLCLVTGLITLLVDGLSVTCRMPVLAGVPVLVVHLAGAANSPGGAPVLAFAGAAAAWLTLLALDGTIELRRWSTSVPLGSDGRRRDGAGSITAAGALVAALALALSVALPALAPEMTPRSVTDGLARRAGGPGSADGPVRLEDETDLARNLTARSERVVLRYRTNDPTPDPLAVSVAALNTWEGASWFDGFRPGSTDGPTSPAGAGLPPTEVTRRRAEVLENHLAPPQVAAPSGVVAATGPARMRVSPAGIVTTAGRLDRYVLAVRDVTPSRSRLASRGTGDEAALEPWLQLDPASATRVTEEADAAAGDRSDPLDVATAIQDHLRGPPFRYSLVLAPPRSGPGGAPLDPVSHFLETRQGYCQQFAAAMVLMARSRGIPARMVVGFLPGRPDENGVRTVLTTDAHAWPELWFEGVGWVRFEPTPGASGSSLPPWAVRDRRADSETPSSSPTSSDVVDRPESSAPSRRTTGPEVAAGTAPPGEEVTSPRSPSWPWLGLLLLPVALVTGPALRRVGERRARSRAADAAMAVEVEWRRLLARLADLGVVSDARLSPRDRAADLAGRATLREAGRAPLGRVVAAVEEARYADPDETTIDAGAVRRDVDATIDAVTANRRLGARARAALWPGSSIATWWTAQSR